MKRLLLDTNVVLWLLLGARDRIPHDVAATLEDPRTPVAVSAVTPWEIAIKRSVGKLALEGRWLTALAAFGFDSLPITALQAAAVETLPWHHRDPFDRLLVAQALVEDRTLVSADPRLGAYGVKLMW